MEKINFQNGTLISPAKVNIDGTVHEIIPAQLDGLTPINATNLNQLQTNVENAINSTENDIKALMEYSTNEKVVEKWIDGKAIYRKVVDIGNLPNSIIKQVPHNINNLDRVIRLFGNAYKSDLSNFLPLPYSSTVDAVHAIGINIEGNNIHINTGIDRSEFTGYVIIEYTKTTE